MVPAAAAAAAAVAADGRDQEYPGTAAAYWDMAEAVKTIHTLQG